MYVSTPNNSNNSNGSNSGSSMLRSSSKHIISIVIGVIVVLLLVGSSNTVYSSDCYTTHGHEWSIKKYVLQDGCNNPLTGAQVVLYHYDYNGGVGEAVYHGYTNNLGFCNLGEWAEGWYSINVSWEGFWNHDPVFFLDRDRVFYNYLTIPPKCVCVT